MEPDALDDLYRDTILDRDPYQTPIESLAEIPIWGTVFEGKPYPIMPRH